MKLRGPIEIQVARIPWPFADWVWAVTVWPVIVYEPQAWARPDIQAHERYHWRDQRRWGMLPWFVAYGLLALLYWGQPANQHPMERRAYEIQRQVREAPNGTGD